MYGASARELYKHAQELLGRLVHERRLTARAVYGFWPANSDGDDIVLYDGTGADGRGPEVARFPMLRQQGDLTERLAKRLVGQHHVRDDRPGLDVVCGHRGHVGREQVLGRRDADIAQ